MLNIFFTKRKGTLNEEDSEYILERTYNMTLFSLWKMWMTNLLFSAIFLTFDMTITWGKDISYAKVIYIGILVFSSEF